MKTLISHSIAALLAAAAVSLAAAQATQSASDAQAAANAGSGTAMSNANVPDTKPDVNSSAVSASGKKQAPSPPMNFADEPIASASTTQGADAQMLDGIVKALNADASLKDAKITVQPDEGNVLLTGRALTGAQKQRATQIAAAQAGERKVVNVIQTDASS